MHDSIDSFPLQNRSQTSLSCDRDIFEPNLRPWGRLLAQTPVDGQLCFVLCVVHYQHETSISGLPKARVFHKTFRKYAMKAVEVQSQCL